MRNFTPLIILVAILIALTFATVKLVETSKPGGVVQNIPLSDFTLADLYAPNQFFSKADLIGEYSLVSFFASWCTTCAAEHDLLLKLKDNLGIKIYGVAWRDLDENTIKYLAKHGNPYAKTATDSKGTLSKILGIEAVPETLLIDPSGTIIWHYQGALDEEAIETIRNLSKSHAETQ